MSYTSPPQGLTAGQTTELELPGSQPFAWVVISNLSGFLLEVMGSSTGTTWLEPFTAMLYPTGSSHSGFSAVPQSLPGSLPVTGAGSQVQATWYQDGEEPAGTWPLSLTAQAVASGIASAGLAGTNVVELNFSVTAGSTDTPPFPAGKLCRIWNWGYALILGQTPPTSGFLQLGVFGTGSSVANDAISYSEGASDRLAGLAFEVQPTGAALSISNMTNQTVDGFVDYSVGG